MKQLSRGLQGINSALFKNSQGIATCLKTKQRQKQENEMFIILYPRQHVLLFYRLFSFFFSFFFFLLFFDGPPSTAGLVTQHR